MPESMQECVGPTLYILLVKPSCEQIYYAKPYGKCSASCGYTQSADNNVHNWFNVGVLYKLKHSSCTAPENSD